MDAIKSEAVAWRLCKVSARSGEEVGTAPETPDQSLEDFQQTIKMGGLPANYQDDGIKMSR
jgi:hypothetical protein